MGEIDKRDTFAEDVFAYRVGKDGAVFISWHGRQVTVLRGRPAARFVARVAALDRRAAQLEMAKVTGNFKRGNERAGKPDAEG